MSGWKHILWELAIVAGVVLLGIVVAFLILHFCGLNIDEITRVGAEAIIKHGDHCEMILG